MSEQFYLGQILTRQDQIDNLPPGSVVMQTYRDGSGPSVSVRESTECGQTGQWYRATEQLDPFVNTDLGRLIVIALPDQSLTGLHFQIASLRAEILRWETKYPCDGGCDYNGPEEMCSRHGRSPSEIWDIVDNLNSQIEDLRSKQSPDKDTET